ncbi:MAG: hypothetical protein KAR01_01800, partial [Desulfocapsa sp.]|nr:hypothetical protein [Desulfocapsa sp.]
QALLAADSFLEEDSDTAFVLAADEGHEHFSPLFDSSISEATPLADGGGGFFVARKEIPGRVSIKLRFYQKQSDTILDTLITELGGISSLQNDCKMILAGIPAAVAQQGEKQLDEFMQKTGLDIPVIHYRRFTGEFASASAVAAVMAAQLLEDGVVEPDKKILVLGFGKYITAMEFARQ